MNRNGSGQFIMDKYGGMIYSNFAFGMVCIRTSTYYLFYIDYHGVLLCKNISTDSTDTDINGSLMVVGVDDL